MRRAVTRRFTLDQTPEGYDLLDAGRIQGRSMVVMG